MALLWQSINHPKEINSSWDLLPPCLWLGSIRICNYKSYYAWIFIWKNRFSFFWPGHAAYGILVPWPGIEPGPRQWKRGVLTTGPPGNSLSTCTFIYMSVHKEHWWESHPCLEQPHLFVNSEWENSHLGEFYHKAHWNFIGGWWKRVEVETRWGTVLTKWGLVGGWGQDTDLVSIRCGNSSLTHRWYPGAPLPE